MNPESWRIFADAINELDALEFGTIKQLPIKVADLETTRETLIVLKNAAQKSLA